MSILSDGFTGWFKRSAADASEEQSAAGTTTGGGSDREPVVVWRATNEMEAQVVKGRLEGEGIPAIIRGEALGAIYGLTSGSLAETAVLVPALLADKAEAILYAATEESAIEDAFDDDSIDE